MSKKGRIYIKKDDRKYIDWADKIVPPPELCQKIPAGKFADTALSWYLDMRYEGSLDLMPSFLCVESRRIPAPTLEEIVAAIYRKDLIAVSMLAGYTKDNKALGNVYAGLGRVEIANHETLAAAALRLWFRVEGGER